MTRKNPYEIVGPGYRGRQKNGQICSWRTEKPTAEEQKLGKKLFKSRHSDGMEIDAYCPCCKQCFLIPTIAMSIKKTGLCNTCDQFRRGLMEGPVCVFRDPTIKEMLEIPRNIPLLNREVEVLRDYVGRILEEHREMI